MVAIRVAVKIIESVGANSNGSYNRGQDTL
jgi:hypothetical protein